MPKETSSNDDAFKIFSHLATKETLGFSNGNLPQRELTATDNAAIAQFNAYQKKKSFIFENKDNAIDTLESVTHYISSGHAKNADPIIQANNIYLITLQMLELMQYFTQNNIFNFRLVRNIENKSIIVNDVEMPYKSADTSAVTLEDVAKYKAEGKTHFYTLFDSLHIADNETPKVSFTNAMFKFFIGAKNPETDQEKILRLLNTCLESVKVLGKYSEPEITWRDRRTM